MATVKIEGKRYNIARESWFDGKTNSYKMIVTFKDKDKLSVRLAERPARSGSEWKLTKDILKKEDLD